MLIFYLLCYAAVLNFLPIYYAQYYAHMHVKELCIKFDCSIRVTISSS